MAGSQLDNLIKKYKTEEDSFKVKSIDDISLNQNSRDISKDIEDDFKSDKDTKSNFVVDKEDSKDNSINSLSSKLSKEIKDNDFDSLNKKSSFEELDSFSETKTKKPIDISQVPEREFENKLLDDSAHLITKYGDVEIYRLKNQSLLHYKIPVPKPTPSQKLIINTLKEATTRLISTDPYKIRDPLQRKNIYYQKIIDILENASEINIPKHLYPFYANSVVKEMTGYGVLEPLLDDDKLEEIMVVGPKKPVYVYHVSYGMMTTNITFYSDEGIQDIVDKIARTLGRQVDISTPLLDARLPDGSRVNATYPPASIDGSTITIRKFREDPYTIVDLITFKTLNAEVAAFLWCAVEGFGAKPANVLISGGTGSGKTTTLNVLANFIPEADRVLTIEDTAELKLPIKHVIRFEGRPPGLEGKGELSLEILTKNTLRMRPDRIIVGEIRHTEATTLFTAMNTGHDGCMGTIHANSAKETIVRITSPPMSVPPLMLAGVDFIIIQKRLRSAKGQVRRITAIAEILDVLENDAKVNIIFKWNPETDTLERTEKPIKFFETVKAYTNFDDQDIKKQIENKINVLNNLITKNIRSISDVSKEIQLEYIKSKS
ncbi:MAG: CpaF family protein [archaeon]|nr:CpaF family protein [archaeon]MDD2477791.1 CpaF family protein [Candidatus ainarchaeum sp.]MDD3084892.1 CpaF family protein [Candidatus ainarchaeum sp.]MDD4221171.1 CpaF family protein [Candidatus ainarchaeum sp.]MDD4662877.1 CpaF family protein [Candidatus ainarchaeum sp.]